MEYFPLYMPITNRSKILSDYKSGMSISELADKYKYSNNVVEGILLNYSLDKISERTTEVAKRRVNLHNKRYSISEIAKIEKVSKQCMSQYFKLLLTHI